MSNDDYQSNSTLLDSLQQQQSIEHHLQQDIKTTLLNLNRLSEIISISTGAASAVEKQRSPRDNDAPVVVNTDSTIDASRISASVNHASTNVKARGATYDGNLCMICNDRASGFHYGVLACEGCKGFFKRVCKEQLKQNVNDLESTAEQQDDSTTGSLISQQSKRHCVFGGNCEINVRTRNRCQYCRIQKCLELGMSKDGIKLGRRSKKFKQNLTNVVATNNASSTSSSASSLNDNNHPCNQKTDETNVTPGVPPVSNSTFNKDQMIALLQPDGNNQLIIQAIDLFSAVSAVASNASSQSAQPLTALPISIVSKQSEPMPNGLKILNPVQLLSSLNPNTNANSNTNTNVSTIKQEQLNNDGVKLIQIEQPNGAPVLDKAAQSTSSPTSTSNNNVILVKANNQESNFQNGANPIILLNGLNLPGNSAANVINSLVLLNNGELALTSSVSSSAVTKDEPTDSHTVTTSLFNMLDRSQVKSLVEMIVQAHKDTDSLYAPYTCYQLASSFRQFDEHNAVMVMFVKSVLQRGLVALLNETKLLDHINTLIENAVLFAKNVPYFMNIHETDRIALLKTCVFEIICVRHSVFYKNSEQTTTNESKKSASASIDLATLAACAVAASESGKSSSTSKGAVNEHVDKVSLTHGKLFIPYWDVWLTSAQLAERLPQLKHFIELLFDFYYFLNSMNMGEYELALFCAYLLFNSDDGTLNDQAKLASYQSLFFDMLVSELEKSLILKSTNASSFVLKTKEQLSVWLKTCFVKLKHLNKEHAKILMQLKDIIQFPDLYAELYNL